MGKKGEQEEEMEEDEGMEDKKEEVGRRIRRQRW